MSIAGRMKPVLILSRETRSEGETIRLGAEFARTLAAGDIAACYGDLGSGKTSFIKGVCGGFGIQEHVSSPTFTIVNEYHSQAFPIYHFDFYRLNNIQELREIGFEDYISRKDGVCLIEWAEKVHGMISSQPRYAVEFSVGESRDTRMIVIRRYCESGS
jgi:tRNA threonylcarbamoyladenosine biosynthesis protein TsaE